MIKNIMDSYFFSGDLIGFGKMVSNLTEDQLVVRISDWIKLVEFAANESGIDKYQLISDTVFAMTKSDTKGLRSLIQFARILLDKGILIGLPVRGGISYGAITWGKLIFGKAVVNAHHLESSQDWVGVTCEADVPNLNELWGRDLFVCYPVPRKAGPIQLCPAVAWNIPEFSDLAKLLTASGLTRPGEILEWDWAKKLDNTIQFRIYLHMLTATKEKGEVFRGLLPIQAIELQTLNSICKIQSFP